MTQTVGYLYIRSVEVDLPMAREYDQVKKRWYFDSVQEFWEAEDLEGQDAYVRKARFEGKLEKGIVDDGKLRAITREDLKHGREPDTIIVMNLLNHDRADNYERRHPPPGRTGLFSAFMSEVEEVAIQVRCRYVWVEKVFNEFLPEKLEERGYMRISGDGFPNPDYVKALSRR